MTEDSENWERLQELFHLAETTSEEDRERVLMERCADPGLRRRVMAIFRGAYIDGEETPRGAPVLTGKIGSYSLIRHLGSGGIGAVYLVERMVGGTPQRAALKMLAPHAAGPFFVERFHREQHILASLEHPNITRMLDGGLSESGQPYLVMEYVNGVHLDVFCDERRLEISERIKLFLQVCDAVGYAHRNLVVHLDLKPSNILVTNDGTIKLLDFGTSKLIQTDSLLTTTVMATPAYASPEQLRNEPVTTACDLYALGAILFELLAGRRPGDKASVAVMIERAMREQEPEKLPDAVTEDAAALQGTTAIRLRQVLKGDMATIVAKCLRARAQDRYLSVDALAEDLRRYLAGRPVLATPQTAIYRIRKFVRRNRKAVAASAAAVLLLIAAISYAAVRQQQALREARRAIEMQAFMAQLFKLASTNYMGKPAASVPEFLKLGATVLPQMIRNPADQRAGEISLAQSMYYDGDHADSEAVLRRVVADAKASGDIPAEAEAEGWAAMVAYKLGKMQDFNTLSTHALQLADKPGVTPAARVWIKTFYTQDRYELGYTTDKDVAIQHAAMIEAQGPGVPANELAYAKLTYVLVSGRTSSLAEQQKLAEEAVAIYRSEPYTVCETAAAEQVLGYLQNQAQKTAASVQTFRDSYNAYRQCRGEDSHDALRAAAALGGALVVAGQPQEAIALLEPTTTKLQTLMGADNLTAMFPLSALARAYVAAGQFKQGEETSIKLFHLLNGKVNPASSTMGVCNLTWARALDGEGQYAEALKHAKLADEEYHADGSKQAGVVRNGQLAHQLALDLQGKLNQKAQ
jgi:eukaryotic-like serine/threonine-protein kinase